MGKTPSPGKWIKNLLGKKSSKSSLFKGSEKLKSAKIEELVVPVSNLPIDPPVVSVPIHTTTAQTVADSGTVLSDEHPSDEINITSVKGNEGRELNTYLVSENSSRELKREQAATKVQAAFKAHQARRAFRTLKGIITLQAIIRGHLVRRQAIATYSCIWGIVKLQALVRGQRARSLDNGIQIQKRLTEPRNSETLQASTCSWMENPAKLSIVGKLLASSSTVLPLKLQYELENPNSAKVWLERWTTLQIWSLSSRATKSSISKPLAKKRTFQAIEMGKGKPKRGIKKHSGPSTENGSTHMTTESEKPKRNVRKASTLNKELLRIENDKVKQGLRKTTSSTKEVKDEKPRPGLKKASNTPLSNGPEKATRKSAEKKKELDGKAPASLSDVPDGTMVESVEEKDDIPNAVSKDSGRDKEERSAVLEKPEQDEIKAVESIDKAEDVQDAHVQLCTENGDVESETTKASDRRASLPAKIDNQDDELTQSGRKIPSYMAPTESAKARLRGQGSPRFAQDRTEKNGMVRRHSLPSSANGKLSTMSPRAHRLLLASAKGSMNNDRSFSSSKDAGDKLMRAEWKR